MSNASTIALEALKKLREKEGPTAMFPADKVWLFASEKPDSAYRPGAINWLRTNGYIEQTGRMANAVTEARAGSKTPEYRFGPRFNNGNAKNRGTSGQSIASVVDAFALACDGQLQTSRTLLLRFVASLLAKRFVILTGLSGSGKTKLAQAFARWITPASPECFAVVPVGADWTSNEHILGYPDNLNGGYVQQTALKLILQAVKHPDLPHFLILDEMNLSHVERYFADLLSLIESNEKIWLHHDDEAKRGIPAQLALPENLFVIGTVNVDETTYMFSPKVLDRANVLEFRVSESDMVEFLDHPVAPDLAKLAEPGTNGAAFGKGFVVAASQQHDAALSEEQRAQLKAELMLFFNALGEHNAEFGFRVGKEIARFVHFHEALSGGSLDFRAAMDAQIVQKLLPKLHGSRNKMTGLLWTLTALCQENHAWKAEPDETKRAEAFQKFMKEVHAAVEAGDEKFDPGQVAAKLRAAGKEAHYPLSFDKLARMWRVLEANGFVSFAEA
ncbi:MAG: AAA ATPase [Limisphaerales bacterium]|nr:MAG: AAA ATPase [Limisphaerales bacterium]KAG0507862.1 MAG: AAA ATPase [Limisphaerales bacterium]TXT48670.1 MAG: AAA ATPase [Limisphaerales bacterium]